MSVDWDGAGGCMRGTDMVLKELITSDAFSDIAKAIGVYFRSVKLGNGNWIVMRLGREE